MTITKLTAGVLIAIAIVALVASRPAYAADSTLLESPPIPSDSIPTSIENAIGAPDRPAADKALDAGRKPAQMLGFFGIAPGMKVADLFAGGGYTTELLSRVVGPAGTVYSQNPIFPPQYQGITPGVESEASAADSQERGRGNQKLRHRRSASGPGRIARRRDHEYELP